MASDLEMANMALSHLGAGATITDLLSDDSEEVDAVAAFLPSVREKMFRDFAWPFATKTAALALVATTPNTEWGFSYRYPTDCVVARRIVTGNRIYTPQNRVAFKIGSDVAGKLIFTDQDQATLEYTALVTNTAFYPADFSLAMSYLLAYYIAPRLAKGDPFGMRAKVLQSYQMEVNAARARAAAEEQPDRPADSEFIRERTS